MSKKQKNIELLDTYRNIDELTEQEDKTKPITIKDLKQFKPLTENQKKLHQKYKSGFNLVLNGCPGSGKTFCILNLALNEVLSQHSDVDKVIIIRSVVPSRDVGFLPGDESNKLEPFEEPYEEICNTLFPDEKNSYKRLKKDGLIQFRSTSFLRGTTYSNAIIIIEESQNFAYHELKTSITRTGSGSRVFVTGDIKQTDLVKSKFDVSGYDKFLDVLKEIKSFSFVTFTFEDIVRDGLVKDFIIAEEKLENLSNPLEK